MTRPETSPNAVDSDRRRKNPVSVEFQVHAFERGPDVVFLGGPRLGEDPEPDGFPSPFLSVRSSHLENFIAQPRRAASPSSTGTANHMLIEKRYAIPSRAPMKEHPTRSDSSSHLSMSNTVFPFRILQDLVYDGPAFRDDLGCLPFPSAAQDDVRQGRHQVRVAGVGIVPA